MSRAPFDVMPGRILLVDDERQIHASVRLRVGKSCELVSCFDAREALHRVRQERFDLCLADVHMPHMDGLTFVDHARQADPALGFVILSAFDNDENLRRAIPLQVFDFIGKPLPDRAGFEQRLPEWIERTRRQRRDLELAEQSHRVAQDLATAQLAHEIELVASESARDALLQTANLLTTIHAHLVTANAMLAPRLKQDAFPSQLWRNLEAARRTADAAVTVADGFFNSAYASRDSSPAFIDAGIRHAIDIARRLSRADDTGKAVDFGAGDDRVVARDLSGIDFLLLMVPLVGAALASAAPSSTVRIQTAPLSRLENVLKDASSREFLWLNRRHAHTSQSAMKIAIRAAAPALTRQEIESWLSGAPMRLSAVAPRGLVSGLQKSHGLLGCATPPAHDEFQLLLVLPT